MVGSVLSNIFFIYYVFSDSKNCTNYWGYVCMGCWKDIDLKFNYSNSLKSLTNRGSQPNLTHLKPNRG